MQEIPLTLLFEPITLPVLQKLLLTLKTYLLGECESVLVLQPLLRVARVQPNIEIEVLTLADVFHLVFRLSCHCSRRVEHLVPLIVKHGSFGATDVEFQIEARTTVCLALKKVDS